jgi:hypothetical protein
MLTVSPANYFSTTPGTNWIDGRVGLNVILYKVAFRKLQFSPSCPPKQHMGQILNKNCKMFIANLNIKQQKNIEISSLISHYICVTCFLNSVTYIAATCLQCYATFYVTCSIIQKTILVDQQWTLYLLS